jgi:hypothetical protein
VTEILTIFQVEAAQAVEAEAEVALAPAVEVGVLAAAVAMAMGPDLVVTVARAQEVVEQRDPEQ